MKSLTRSALVLSLVALIAACSTAPLDEEKGSPVEARSEAGASGAESAGMQSRGSSASESESSRSADPLNDPASPLAKRSVYFDFDSFVIKDEFRSLLEAHAAYLLANPSQRIVIQGNTDERGSREYNLALGQKRSEAVRRALSTLGVPEAQAEAVSFGEERPKATGTDEGSLAENRRADIVY
ncbi:MAG: peptidoglycan-associated lipoprotein Pal [Pseudomonadota bacterium]|jgi:peptidoglycan-associated lipoprotein